MIDQAIRDALLERLDVLPLPAQRQVLQFAKGLASAPLVGTPGRDLLPLAGTMSEECAQQMLDAIEEGCGRTSAGLRPPGTPGQDLMKFVGVISPDDCDRMMQAINEDCERVDADGW